MSDRLIPTIDGPQIVTSLTRDDCCPPSICNLDLNSFVCSFFAYLPKGPLWDYWKRVKAEQLLSGVHDNPYQQTENPSCLTLIDHAVYTATKLYHILRHPLQTAIWESNPLTAFYTRSNWLNTFGWSDCFSGPSASAALGFPTPYQAVCNAMLPTSLCAPNTEFSQMSGNATINPNPIINIEVEVKAACPAELTLAVEYGILVALQRNNIGVIKNIDGLNFIIAPLGAEIAIVDTTPPNAPCPIPDCYSQMTGNSSLSTEFQQSCQTVDVNNNQMLGTEDCTPWRPLFEITLRPSSLFIAAGPGITEPLTCDTSQEPQTEIPSSYYYPGYAMQTTVDCPPGTIAGAGTIWPGLMAAECILRSILPYYLNYKIVIN